MKNYYHQICYILQCALLNVHDVHYFFFDFFDSMKGINYTAADRKKPVTKKHSPSKKAKLFRQLTSQIMS